MDAILERCLVMMAGRSIASAPDDREQSFEQCLPSIDIPGRVSINFIVHQSKIFWCRFGAAIIENSAVICPLWWCLSNATHYI